MNPAESLFILEEQEPGWAKDGPSVLQKYPSFFSLISIFDFYRPTLQHEFVALDLAVPELVDAALLSGGA